jgi:hypothetical protein
MKKIIILLFITFSGLCFAQGSQNTSVFHRLLVYNSENEVMLVKIKGTDVWVTPGFYQDSVQCIKEGLHKIALTYGMTISNPELKGAFSMRRETGETREMLIRNIYRCNYLGGKVHFPENQSFKIGEIKWLPMKEVLSVISFESIRMFIKQTYDFPNIVWGGSISAIREDKQWNYKIVEAFYPLFSLKNPR